MPVDDDGSFDKTRGCIRCAYRHRLEVVEGEFSDVTSSHAGKGVVRYAQR